MLSTVSPPIRGFTLAPQSLAVRSSSGANLVGGFQEIRKACSARQERLACILRLTKASNSEVPSPEARSLQGASQHTEKAAADNAAEKKPAGVRRSIEEVTAAQMIASAAVAAATRKVAAEVEVHRLTLSEESSTQAAKKAAEEAAAAEAQRKAEEKAAEEKEKASAEKKAAEEAAKKAAEEAAAAEANKKAEEQAAAEKEKKALAEKKAAEEATKKAAEEAAAAEANRKAEEETAKAAAEAASVVSSEPGKVDFEQWPIFMKQVALAVSAMKAFQFNGRDGPSHAARRLWEESYASEGGYWTELAQSEIPQLSLRTEDLTKAAPEAKAAFSKCFLQMREHGDNVVALGKALARAVHRFELVRSKENGFEGMVAEAGSRCGQPRDSRGNGALGRPEELDEFSEVVATAWDALELPARPTGDLSGWVLQTADDPTESNQKREQAVYLVDNSQLKANTSGVGYRSAKRMDAKCAHGILAAWDSLVPGVDEGDGWLCCPTPPGCQELEAPHYLPLAVNGHPTLISNVYMVDNSQLQAGTQGLKYWCAQTTNGDAATQHAEAPWGSIVSGIDRGDGWLLVRHPLEAQGQFLPVRVEGVQVISKATPRVGPVLIAGAPTSPSSGRPEAMAKVLQDTRAFVEAAQGCAAPEILESAQALVQEVAQSLEPVDSK